MNDESIGIACALVLGLFLLAQEQFIVGKLAGVVVLAAAAFYEWRRHFGTRLDQAKRPGDALSPSRREN